MSATVEKKVALTIEMKTAGGQQVGQLTVNLKGLDDASKKAASSGEKTSITLKKISKGFGEIIKIGALATGAVSAVAAAIAGVSAHLASQSGAAQQTALAFGQLDKSLMSAADQSGALKRGLDVIDSAAKDLTKYFNSDEGKKAINDFFQLIVFGAGLAIEKMADLTKAVRHPVDFMEKHLSKWGNFFGANTKFVEQIKEGDWFDKLVANAREVGTALKESVLAGESVVPPSFDDPKLRAEREAAAMAAKEREIARYIELATKATTQEQALNASTLAWFALNEQKKMKITGETASAAIARQEAIADKIRAVNELEVQLQNKFQAKYIADLGARADAQADFAEKLRGLRQSQAEYQAELEGKKASDTRTAPSSFITNMMAASKAKSFMGPKTEEQTEKDKKTLEDYAESVKGLAQEIGSGIANIMGQAIASIADGSKSALQALGGMLGGIISMMGQMLIQLGTAALVASALSAIPFFAPLVGGPGAAAAGVAAIAAGALMVAAGAGLNSAIGMETGGLVLGGSPNFDSVPALLQRGEYVVPAAQVRQNVAAGRAPDDSGSSRGGGAGAGVTISVTQQSFVPGTKADFNRQVRDAVLPSIRQLARQGLLVLK